MRKPSSLHIPAWTQVRLRWGMVWPTKRPHLTRRQVIIGLLCVIIAYNYLGKWAQETRAAEAEKRLKRFERPKKLAVAPPSIEVPLPPRPGY